jgi:hypothetical protein
VYPKGPFTLVRDVAIPLTGRAWVRKVAAPCEKLKKDLSVKYFFFVRFSYLAYLGNCRNTEKKILEYFSKTNLTTQAAIVIQRLFICKFAYSQWNKWSKFTTFQSKMDFLSLSS